MKTMPRSYLRKGSIVLVACLLSACSLTCTRMSPQVEAGMRQGQVDIARVEEMPNLPEPYAMRDWQALAQAYDRFVFDYEAGGEYLPLIWLDDSRINVDRTTFGLFSYVGAPHQGPGKGAQEGVCCLGAVIGATLAGIDKTAPPHDYVLMCESWQNRKNGLNLVLNAFEQETGGSFWYEIWPQMLLAMLADKYPGHGSLADIARVGAERWREGVQALSGTDGVPNFNHTAFNLRTMTPVDNGKWKEPDAAAGVAWLQYMAWSRFQDERFLKSAEACLRFLQEFENNPYYEILLPYGVVTAARMNAEQGRSYDVGRLLDWCFGASNCRDWGTIVGNWYGYDCSGLVGAHKDKDGYAFAMNTFSQAAALMPLVRYDARYARAIGKWMLNLANAARLFYPDALPEDQQTSAFWKGDPGHVIAYEGLRHHYPPSEKGPVATGDPIFYKWGPKTDLSLYGSGYVGFLGGIVRKTNVERILQLDCLATDFYHDKAYPTYLYFNPYDHTEEIEIAVGAESKDLYDAATHRFIKKAAQDAAHLIIPPDTAVVVVLTPAGGKKTRQGNRLLVDGTVIDYAANQEGE